MSNKNSAADPPMETTPALPAALAPGRMDDLNERIDRADHDLARRIVRSVVAGPLFDDFHRWATAYRDRNFPPEIRRVQEVRMKDEDRACIGHLPVGVLNERAHNALPQIPGVEAKPTRSVRLSPETAVKQSVNHRDLTVADYRRIPGVIEFGSVFRKAGEEQGRNLVLLREIDNDYSYVVFVKQTSRNEVFLTSFRKTRKRDIEKMLRGLEEVADWNRRSLGRTR